MKRSARLESHMPLERGEPLKARRWGVKRAPKVASWRDEYMPERMAPKAAKLTPFERSYMAFVRTLPCCASHLGNCRGRVQASHITLTKNEKGAALKVDVTQTVPHCDHHHRQWDFRAGFNGNPFASLTKDERFALGREWAEATQLLAIPEDRAQADAFEELGLGRVVSHADGGWSWMPGDAVERAA